MSLNNNIISDITPLKNFKSPNLKVLDLSYNKIENINPFKDFSKKEQKIETILLNNNEINNADVFKKKIFPYIKEINLDENHLLKKDIEEIQDIINGVKRIKKKKFNINRRNNNFREEAKKEEAKKENLRLPLIHNYSYNNLRHLTNNMGFNHH